MITYNLYTQKLRVSQHLSRLFVGLRYFGEFDMVKKILLFSLVFFSVSFYAHACFWDFVCCCVSPKKTTGAKKQFVWQQRPLEPIPEDASVKFDSKTKALCKRAWQEHHDRYQEQARVYGRRIYPRRPRKKIRRQTVLHEAVLFCSDKIELASLIKKNRRLIDRPDRDGDTPLHFACRFKKLYALVELLRNRADVDVQNNNGDTPLHIVCREHYRDGLLKLLKCDPALNVQNKNLDTPWHVAFEGIGTGEEYFYIGVNVAFCVYPSRVKKHLANKSGVTLCSLYERAMGVRCKSCVR